MYLFRAKKCKTGEWVTGYYLNASDTWRKHVAHKSWILSRARSNGGWLTLLGRWAVQDNTVSMASASHDVDGKLIFDGDILSDYKRQNVVLVRFDGNGFLMWKIYHSDKSPRMDYLSILGSQVEELSLKVIGNMWDNPELLKGKLQ